MNDVPEGWVPRPGPAFDTLVGPFYFPPGEASDACGFLADARHGNRRDVVHGGAVSTAFDVALGIASRAVAGKNHCATVQINVQFVRTMNLGAFAIIRSEVVRATRSLVFQHGVMTVGDQVIATANGVWKILRLRDETQ
jgi:acyl-coenzyme A thioesterase PaaI-like protein